MLFYAGLCPAPHLFFKCVCPENEDLTLDPRPHICYLLPVDIRELIISHLHALQQQGVSTLPVDDDARRILRDWMLSARNGGARPIQRPSPPVSQPLVAAPTPMADDTPTQGLGLMEELQAEAAAPPQEPEQEAPLPFFRPGGSTPEEMWANMAALLPRWKPLRELGTLRQTAVPGQGSRNASIMFVGDAPGYADEKAALPFQGEAGGKLDGMLRAMGLTRADVYITHLVKFRPAMPRQTLNNRPPTAREVACSVPVLQCEVQLVQPRVIVALGVVAARGLLSCGELPLAACQNMRGEFCGIPVVVTHHPSYLLRTSDIKERRRLWEEMLRVMEMAGLPVSAKQRGYFLVS